MLAGLPLGCAALFLGVVPLPREQILDLREARALGGQSPLNVSEVRDELLLLVEQEPHASGLVLK